MKTLNINGKNFQLSKEVFAFLDSYRKRIEDYVQKNAIDLDLHEDILQRLADKLTEQEMEGTLDQKSVIQIVNDLGEAEEIFSDEIDSFETQKEGKKEKSDSKDLASLAFYQKLQKAKRSRPQE